MKRLIPVLIVAVLAVAGTALANTYGTVDLQFVGETPPATTGYIYLNRTDLTGGSTWYENVYLPPYDVKIIGVQAGATAGVQALLNQTKQVYCLDLISGVGTSNNYVVQDLSDPLHLLKTSGGTMALTLETWRVDALKALFSSHFPTSGGAAGDSLSLAAWELVYETATSKADFSSHFDVASFSSSTGFKAAGGSITAGVVNDANDWISSALAAGPPSSGTGVYILSDPTYQDFAFMVTGHLVSNVPEPTGFARLASLALLGLPIGAIVLYRRRRRA
jgi:hypothetical protein